MASFALAKLINRKLIKISGPDCYPHLQGLLSNDLRYLYEPDRIKKRKHARITSSVLSTFMLNAQGRVICDMMLYRTPMTRYQCEFTPPGQAKEPDELLIECDSSLATGLANTLYGYRVRRKISLQIQDEHNVWCLYPNLRVKDISHNLTMNHAYIVQKTNQLPSKEILNSDLTFVSDPRIEAMGSRIITRANEFNEIKSILRSHVNFDIQQASVEDYTVYRYRLGVGEGPKDHPEGNCLPLECNADLLGAVSFDKGCYLGQELTARIHYTGVIRKRLMPIVVDKNDFKNEFGALPLIDGSDIVDRDTKKKIGVLRHVSRYHALALLRYDLITETTNLIHDGSKTKVTTWRPFWWDSSQ